MHEDIRKPLLVGGLAGPMTRHDQIRSEDSECINNNPETDSASNRIAYTNEK